MPISTLASRIVESAPAPVVGTISVPAALSPRLLMLESALPAEVRGAVSAIHEGKMVTEGQIDDLVTALRAVRSTNAGPLAARLADLAPKKLSESAAPKKTYAGHKLIKESTATRSGKVFVMPPAAKAAVKEPVAGLVEGLRTGKVKNIKWRDAYNVVVEGHVVAVEDIKGVGTVVTAVTSDHLSDVRLHVRDVIA